MRQVLALLLPLLLSSTGHAGGGNDIVAAGAAGKVYAVFTEQGSVQYGTRKLTINLYEKKDGRLLWKRQIEGRLYQASSATRNLPGWGMVNSVLWVSHTTGGEHWHVDNTGFRISDGKLLWENIDVGYPLAFSQGKILFLRNQSQSPYFKLLQVNLVLNDLKTGEATHLNLRIPERANCGSVNDYAWDDAAYVGFWADARFLYARRKDACGVFVARFDWHGEEEQRPTITPE
ncbi:hypothetical protein E5F05_12235 [Deinococcus metallilatus]|uniref:Uncharacterized protein n=1 Tax=Deinococcus metallilatus TaxID=1211322 RepID=A0AAJ5JY13_9DEIO|nr:hypothetical protein [Deinococcus metallilatus]MBB5295195.1 hypothetical protein [Deinococcus metallilatus]QBY08639.1 hypothetical protein E5F05_12235 [Deinococcus metallilatus]RXJ10518.1 hypothetical protein ERJ73_11065 [Deinococcus metallilatus]TLK26489.1 hypothetical protein FCS05_10815 [Deinococcus metallilatus]GMA14969.1 hypothetical protein GCM10025871_13000 [Deinococcus metallilatus]